jgi:hypothetical protein
MIQELLPYLKRVSFFPLESRPSCSSPSRNSSTVAFLDGLVLDGPGESGELMIEGQCRRFDLNTRESSQDILRSR